MKWLSRLKNRLLQACQKILDRRVQSVAKTTVFAICLTCVDYGSSSFDRLAVSRYYRLRCLHLTEKGQK